MALLDNAFWLKLQVTIKKIYSLRIRVLNLFYRFRQKENQGAEGLGPEGRPELVHHVGRGLEAHHLRGTPAMYPSLRHSGPQREHAPVADPVHSGPGPAKPVERVRKGLRQPGRGWTVCHQHIRHQAVGAKAQVPHVQAALQGARAGKSMLNPRVIFTQYRCMSFIYDSKLANSLLTLSSCMIFWICRGIFDFQILFTAQAAYSLVSYTYI